MRYTVTILSSFLSASLACAISPGCGTGIPLGYTGNTTQVTLPSGRVFYYHLPSGYSGNQTKNTFFSFHGGSKSPLEQEGLSGLSDPNFNPDGIAVYPQGQSSSTAGAYYWNPNPKYSLQSPNDLDFTLDVLAWVQSNLCVAQIYATGKSDGGGLTNLLACNTTTAAQFAAFASVSGAYYEDSLAINCAVNREIPFIAFHGLNDTVIPYTGKNPTYKNATEKTYPIDDWLQGWIARDNLISGPVNDTVYEGPVVRSIWNSSTESGLFVFYQEDNLGHVWASTLPNDDCKTKSIPQCPLGHYSFNATTVIVNFLLQWTL